MRGRKVRAEVGGHTDVCHPSTYWSEEKARKVPLGHHLVLLVQPLEGLLVGVGQRDGVVLWSTLLVGGGGCARACAGSELGECLNVEID